MTIRFLMAWNGHSPDEINSSLGAVEESRLVGLGFATYDLDGANDGQEVAVFAKPNPLCTKHTTRPRAGFFISRTEHADQ